MASSFVDTIASGSSALVSVTMPYLARSHIHVYLNGVLTSAYTWNSATVIHLNSTPAAGTIVRVRRITPKAALVVFSGGDLDPADLNTSKNQALYLAEEAYDLHELDLAQVAVGGAWDAKGYRITNVGAPTASTDAARKGELDAEIATRTSADAALLSLIGASGSIEAPSFASVEAAKVASLSPTLDYVRAAGRGASGDGGEGLFKETLSSETVGFTNTPSGRYFEPAGSRYSAKTFGILPEDAGAAALINDAMEWLYRRKGGGAIEFLGENYHVSETVLNQYHNVSLLGVGSSWHSGLSPSGTPRWDQFKGTRFLWTGGADKMVVYRPPIDPSGPGLKGCGLDKIVLDAAGVATYGLEVLSLMGGMFPKVIVADATVCNIHLGVVADGEISATEPRVTQHCHFGLLFSRNWLPAALSNIGVLIDGDDDYNVSFCHFDEIFYIHKDGVGLYIKSSDACEFTQVIGYRLPDGAGIGTRIAGGMSAFDYPRRHHFDFLQAGAGGLSVTTNAVPPIGIKVDHYSLGNGTPAPSFQGGSSVSYHIEEAWEQWSASGTFPAHRFHRADAGAAQFIAETRAYSYDHGGNYQQYTGIGHYSLSHTSGAEEGRIYFDTVSGGAVASRAYFGAGLVVGSPTGGDKGAGTVNAQAVYDDNTLLTCYVLEWWRTGDIDTDFWDSLALDRVHPAVVEEQEVGRDDAGNPLFKSVEISAEWVEPRIHERARTFKRVAADRLDLDKWADFLRTEGKLPAFPDPDKWSSLYGGNMTTGEIIQRLWETVEVQAVHIVKLHERLKALEGGS